MLEGYCYLPLVLAAYEGVYFGLAVLLARKLSASDRTKFYLLIPLSFALFEFLRGFGTFGFPWASTGFFLAGTGLRHNLMFYGVYGSGLLLSLLAGLLLAARENRKLTAAVLMPLALLAVPLFLVPEAKVERNIKAAAAQDIILVEEKHSTEQATRRMLEESFYHLYEKALKQKPELILLPETAFPEALNVSPAQQKFFRDSLLYDVLIVVGAERREDSRYYNSLYLFDRTGVKTYDKRFLVPFGEFVPGRSYLDWIPEVANTSDFTPGKSPEVVETSLGIAGPGICWESALPFFGRAAALKGAQFLLFSTNDNWFLFSDQSMQHWRHTRAQADMSGLAVIQSANAGVTGVYFNGREKTLPVWSHDVLVAELPVVKPNRSVLEFAAVFETAAVLFSVLPLLVLFSSLIKNLLNKS